jgi:hypothetical protein
MTSLWWCEGIQEAGVGVGSPSIETVPPARRLVSRTTDVRALVGRVFETDTVRAASMRFCSAMTCRLSRPIGSDGFHDRV